MEASYGGGQGPAGAVAPYMEWNGIREHQCKTQEYRPHTPNHKVRHPRCDYNKLDWSVYT